MATKRRRNASWEYRVRKKGVLDRPFYFTTKNEQEGDRYAAQLEALLDRGILPTQVTQHTAVLSTIAEAIHAYLEHVSRPATERALLDTIYERWGQDKLIGVKPQWANAWVQEMKRKFINSPTTIRHYVGALARCFEWIVTQYPQILPANPLRQFPRGYSKYTDADIKAVKASNPGKPIYIPEDTERERRLAADEEMSTRKVLDSAKIERQGAMEALFDLALESAMRMREMYTLTLDQVSLKERTIWLDKTKNGDKRQVPLTSVALKSLRRYLDQVEKGERGMGGFSLQAGRLFPWWDGSRESLADTTWRLSRRWGWVFDHAGCGDLHFHDLRHEATSRLYERTNLSDMEIAKITGHKDLRVLRRYANLRASDLADKLW